MAFRNNWADLDKVNSKVVEHPSDLESLSMGERDAGRLLSFTECAVEYFHIFRYHAFGVVVPVGEDVRILRHILRGRSRT